MLHLNAYVDNLHTLLLAGISLVAQFYKSNAIVARKRKPVSHHLIAK